MPEAISRPLPLPDDLTRFYWEGAKQRKLVIQRCRQCGTYIHFPRPVCYHCLSTDLGPSEVSGRGTLYTYTVAVQAFHPFFADRLPYIIATVDLPEQAGLRVVSNLIDCAEEDVRIGMPVEVVFEDVGDEITLPLFRPASG